MLLFVVKAVLRLLGCLNLRLSTANAMKRRRAPNAHALEEPVHSASSAAMPGAGPLVEVHIRLT